MAFTFRPAHRDNAKLIIALAAPTGAGKTLSALMLATGIVEVTGGRIAFIDTENGRALQYAPPGETSFDFDHAELGPPFSPDRYREALESAEAHAGNNGVVIIDSMSHEHNGPGGVLEMHDAEVERLAAGREGNRERYNFPAWSVPKAARRKFVARLLQCRAHVILCFRARERSAMAKDDRGRQTIVSIGWVPDTGDELPYEATIFALLNPEKKGVPIIDGFAYGKLPLNMRSLVSTEVALTADTGRRLAKWAGNGRGQAIARPTLMPQTEPGSGGAAGGSPAPKTNSLITVWLAPNAQIQAPAGEALISLANAFDDVTLYGELNALLEHNEKLLERLKGGNKERMDAKIANARQRVEGPADHPMAGVDDLDEDLSGPEAKAIGPDVSQGSLV